MNPDEKTYTLSQLAQRLDGQLVGPPAGPAAEIHIRGAAGIDHAGAGDITFVDDPSKLSAAEKSQAAAVIVPAEIEKSTKPIIKVKNPRLAFAEVLGMFAPPISLPAGVHPTAIIGDEVSLGENVAIGPYVIIGKGTKIGEGAVIYPQTHVGENVNIGAGTLIHPRVTIGWGTEIGAGCILHSGVVLGADGFGFNWDGECHRKIPQIGRVVIEDDVEIGANTTIDRATTHITHIGRGTKIDDQVHIAHNVTMGENCIIAGKVGISGSVRLGNRVTLAGQVGVVDHVSIGDDAIVMARAAVFNDLPAGSVSSGTPAYPHREYLRVEAAVRKLPELLRQIRELKSR